MSSSRRLPEMTAAGQHRVEGGHQLQSTTGGPEGARGVQPEHRPTVKRAVVGVPAVHASLQSRTAGPGRPRGYESLEPMVSAGLSNYDDGGLLAPSWLSKSRLSRTACGSC